MLRATKCDKILKFSISFCDIKKLSISTLAFQEKEDMDQRAHPGFEPDTSRMLDKNHIIRPTSPIENSFLFGINTDLWNRDKNLFFFNIYGIPPPFLMLVYACFWLYTVYFILMK